MREILFRGKFVGTGEWVYGSILTDIYGSYPCILKSAYCDDECKIGFDSTPVEPSTIGQYTGLKDINGAKIFEGDIVSFCEYADLFAVRFENFSWIISNRSVLPYYEKRLDSDSSQYEVIGNIYDKPGLIL